MAQIWADPIFWIILFGSLVATGLLTPPVMKLARKVGAIDRGGYRRVYKGEMPLLGGLAIGIPFLVVCLLLMVGALGVFKVPVQQLGDLAVLAVGSLAILGLGVVDDIRGLRARTKLLVQTVVALFICLTGHTVLAVNLPFSNGQLLTFDEPITRTVLTVVWIVGLTNAFNIIDGVDGLAAGVAFIASLGLGIIATLSGNLFVGILSLCLAASLLAFLRFNFHPARIFLGDTGSMFLGFSLSVIAIIGSVKSQVAVMFVAPILALGFPIFETLISMFRRALRGRPIFSGDQFHTHHRLLRMGFTQRQTVAILYGAALLCTGSAIMYVMLNRWPNLQCIPVALFASTSLGLAWVAGYIRPGDLLERLKRHPRNKLLSSLVKYAALSLNSGNSLLSPVEILRMARREMKLRFLEVALEDGPVLMSSGRLKLLSASGSLVSAGNAPQLIVNGGNAQHVEVDSALVDSLEEIRIDSVDGCKLIVRYQPSNESQNELDQQDIEACLADLFGQIKVEFPEEAADAVPYLNRLEALELENNGGRAGHAGEPVAPLGWVKHSLGFLHGNGQKILAARRRD